MSDFPTYYYPLHISSVYLLIVVMASHKPHCFKPKQAQNLDENSDGDGEMKNILETVGALVAYAKCYQRQNVHSLSKTSRLENKTENTNAYMYDCWL